nr:MAG TPA: hypothetical protein [Caudoviricetes sp.]
MQTICKIVFWIYLICLPISLILTVIREYQSYKIKDAPNKVLGFIYHFITVWLITPFFVVHLVTNKIRR